jgi:uncharacterized membrane protein HdeD (DUF308 family)
MLTAMTCNWWLLALRGAAAILFGVLAVAWPAPTLSVLIVLYGAYALVDGLTAILVARGCHDDPDAAWPLAAFGVIGVVAALLALLWPEVTEDCLLLVIAWWAVFKGILEIALAVRLIREIEDEPLLGLGGAASILLGLFLLLCLGSGARAMFGVISAYAILYGALALSLALHVRGLREQRDSGAGGRHAAGPV